ncbi:Inner membrane protein YjdF [Planctomycetes bacterium CA13]|uniref:Inner membrane protein YjdF n=1 Tax=Novipirellula herctigrandis TaxID=2527986 RepID=A0A5C5YP59_9BACT|nr:Inner membrane protein YjdF [Planctomycetes bacterium CA13]
MRFQITTLLITVALTAASFYQAPYPNELWLQHMPTVVLLVALAASSIWFRISKVSFLCIVAFLWLHILGARWIYSFVPYDDWSCFLLGQSASEHFGWQRNHYDRMVHLASGLLVVPPASEVLQRWGGMRPLGAAMMAIAVVLAIGAVYEILEWQIAVAFSPQQAEAYNGQQGDVWDPQKDLALAWIGAAISAGLVFRKSYDRPTSKAFPSG